MTHYSIPYTTNHMNKRGWGILAIMAVVAMLAVPSCGNGGDGLHNYTVSVEPGASSYNTREHWSGIVFLYLEERWDGPEESLNVSGIGSKTYEVRAEWVCVLVSPETVIDVPVWVYIYEKGKLVAQGSSGVKVTDSSHVCATH